MGMRGVQNMKRYKIKRVWVHIRKTTLGFIGSCETCFDKGHGYLCQDNNRDEVKISLIEHINKKHNGNIKL